MSLKALVRTTAVLALFIVPAATAAQQQGTPAAPPVSEAAQPAQPAQPADPGDPGEAADPAEPAEPAEPAQVLQTPAPPEEADTSDEQDAVAEAEMEEEPITPPTAEEIKQAQDQCMQKRRKSMRRCTHGDLPCRAGVLNSYRGCMKRSTEA